MMTSDEAIQILQSSNTDPFKIIAALEIASLKLSSRPVVIAYLDGPSHTSELTGFLANEPPTDGTRDSSRILIALAGLPRFFASCKDPVFFEVFKHLMQNSFVTDFFGADRMINEFAHDLPAGSPLEPLFLDYVEDAIFKGGIRDLADNGLCVLAMDNSDAAYDRIGQIISSDEFWKQGNAIGSVDELIVFFANNNCYNERVMKIFYKIRAPLTTPEFT